MLDLSRAEAFVAPAALRAKAEAYAWLLREAACGMPRYSGSTGWLDPACWAGEEALTRLTTKAAQVRTDADAFVLVGVGGSNNAARAVIEALCPGGSPEIIYAGNSTAASAMEGVLKRLERKRSVYIDVIAKNFETLEPGATFRVLRSWLLERYGEAAAARIMTTGTPGSRLWQLSKEQGWDFFTFPQDVGGRYSALTDVGLLPMAVAGADIRALTKGALTMREMLLKTPAAQNPALLYAAERALLYEAGYRVETLSFFEPSLRYFASWWVQLFGESCGKDGKGLYPASCAFSEELHSMGQFLQDGTPLAAETFLRAQREDEGPALSPDGVDDGFSYLDALRFDALNEAAFSAALHAHASRLPCALIDMGAWNEESFGALLYFFELACTFSCVMEGVNPFDQPGVEEYKQSMFLALGKERN